MRSRPLPRPSALAPREHVLVYFPSLPPTPTLTPLRPTHTLTAALY